MCWSLMNLFEQPLHRVIGPTEEPVIILKRVVPEIANCKLKAVPSFLKLMAYCFHPSVKTILDPSCASTTPEQNQILFQ